MNPLQASGKPLFFRVGNPDEAGLRAPVARQGVAVRVAARSLSVMQKEGLIRAQPAGAVWRVASDEGAYLMGDDVAPCPLSFMTTGMVASVMEALLLLARERGIDMANVRLVQDNFYTMEGSALRGTMIGGALPVDLSAEIDSDAGEEDLSRLLRDAVSASPVAALLRGVHASKFTLTHNGREIPTGRVAPIGGPAAGLPSEAFEMASPAGADWIGLIVRNGMTPETEEVTSGKGSSYAENQSRRLHLQGICTNRPDGLIAVEARLYNPLGSIFHYLCDSAVGAGGQGRAPDPLSYASAGVAFCFMTQFGRYAKILRKDLKTYSVVQDTFFSAGGEGRAATVEPVETHVHLETGEDDDFARNALDMSEQTCFLHALCRTDLTVNCTLSKVSVA